ncbi:hypothetical protein OAS86_07140 [Gammaproteobacteria bacterium]|nr:hypothetical protein [Gammaproteobacteria bacterium]
MIHTRRFVFGALIALSLGSSLSGLAQTLRVGATVANAQNGLLSALLEEYSRQSAVPVRLLEVPGHDVGILSASGKVDVVVNSSERVTKALNYNGYIAQMVPLMHRDYVIIGPYGDPAGISEERQVKAGLRRLFRARRKFISLGDHSQDHANEVGLWIASGYRPQGEWYRSVGLDANGVLAIASNNGAYALIDRPTWDARSPSLRLQVVMSNAYELSKTYHLLIINPGKVAGVDSDGARAFVAWASGSEGQRVIANYSSNGVRPYRSINADR